MIHFKKYFMIFLLITIGHGAIASQIEPSASLKEPNISTISLLVWANEAIVTTYTYNFVSYKKDLQNASQYFTVDGWKKYMSALENSGDLKNVRDKKLVVSAVATGTPVVLEQKVIEGKYTWKIQMPILVTYQNNLGSTNKNLVVALQVVKTPSHIGMRGLGISEFVAVADKSK